MVLLPVRALPLVLVLQYLNQHRSCGFLDLLLGQSNVVVGADPSERDRFGYVHFQRLIEKHAHLVFIWVTGCY